MALNLTIFERIGFFFPLFVGTSDVLEGKDAADPMEADDWLRRNPAATSPKAQED